MPLAARRRVTFLSRQECNQRNAHPIASPALRPVPCAPRISRALRNSPESKNDSGSNSARALLRLKLRCSASSDGGTSTATATYGAIRFAHCALLGLLICALEERNQHRPREHSYLFQQLNDPITDTSPNLFGSLVDLSRYLHM